jgi:hypothetical protein
MQVQEIITYLIVSVASGFVLVSLYKTLFPSKDKLNQNGCSSGCNCDAKVLRKELMIKRKPIINNMSDRFKTRNE